MRATVMLLAAAVLVGGCAVAETGDGMDVASWVVFDGDRWGRNVALDGDPRSVLWWEHATDGTIRLHNTPRDTMCHWDVYEPTGDGWLGYRSTVERCEWMPASSVTYTPAMPYWPVAWDGLPVTREGVSAAAVEREDGDCVGVHRWAVELEWADPGRSVSLRVVSSTEWQSGACEDVPVGGYRERWTVTPGGVQGSRGGRSPGLDWDIAYGQ